MDAALPPGYVMVERLGSGGFATVWLAEQGQLGRRVAVKVLGTALDDAERERRFVAECRAIGSLSGHPAVVTVHDAGTTAGGHPYLVMEHLPGGSLHDRLADRGPVPWAEVLDVGVHVADALAAAHDAGILHRDVKPANILLDANGDPKLGDFGIARLGEGADTATGTLVGTIPFTPPEVLSGHRPGPTADVWALGATLHTLLAGTSPFGGDHEEPPAATIARVLRSEAPALPPSVPEPLRDLIGDALAPSPDDRPRTAGELVRRLQGIQADRGLPVTPARATRDTSPPTGPPADVTLVGLHPVAAATEVTGGPVAPPIPPPKSGAGAGTDAGPGGGWRGRRPAMAVLAVLIAVVVAVVGAIVGAIVLTGGGGGDGADRAGEPGSTTVAGGPEAEPPVIRLALGGASIPAIEGPRAVPTATTDVALPCGETGCAAVADAERIVVVDAAGSVRALDPDGTGDEPLEWQAELGDLGAAPALALVPGSLVVTPSEGTERRYLGLDPATGDLRWDDPPVLPDHVGPLAVVDGPAGATVLVHLPDPDDGTPDGLDRGSVVALDTASGAVAWQQPGRVVGLTPERAYLTDGARVRALDRGTGDEVWAQDVPTGDRAVGNDRPHATVAGGLVVAASAGEAVALDAGSGRERWRRPVPDQARPTPEAGGVAPALGAGATGEADVVVVAGPDGDVAFEAATGTMAWQRAAPGQGILGADASPLVWVARPGRILVGLSDGRVSVRSTADGEVRAETRIEELRGWAVLDGQVLGWTGSTVTALDEADLDRRWEVDGLALSGLAPAPRGFVALGPSGPVRYEG